MKNKNKKGWQKPCPETPHPKNLYLSKVNSNNRQVILFIRNLYQTSGNLQNKKLGQNIKSAISSKDLSYTQT